MSQLKEGPLFPIIDNQYKMDETPTIRVGIVLAEDDRQSVCLVIPDEKTSGTKYQVVVDGDDIGHFENVTELSFKLEDGALKLSSSESKLSDLSGEIIHIIPLNDDIPKKPKMGLQLKDVVAGRGFHWAKEIDQYLPGSLEIRLSNKYDEILVINELSVEDYLIGVITSEMSAECPVAYMKAQAVSARSWLLAQPISPYPNEPFDVCNDDQCQRYQGSEGWTEESIKVIQECYGETLITKDDKYCDARYSKSTGGISEDAFNVWHTEIDGLDAMIDAPEGDPIYQFFPVTQDNIYEYLTGEWIKNTKAFASPAVVNEQTIMKYLGRVDEAGEYFRWKIDISQEELIESLTERSKLDEVYEVIDIIPQERGRSGRLKKIEIKYRKAPDKNPRSEFLDSEYHIRAGLWKRFLYSSCFVMEKHFDNEDYLTGITLHGGGWGHGAGLCQIGGIGRALSGQDYKEILMAYFSNVRLEKIY